MPEEILVCESCGGGKWTLLVRGMVRCLTCEQIAPDIVVGTIRPDARWCGEKKPGSRRLAGEPIVEQPSAEKGGAMQKPVCAECNCEGCTTGKCHACAVWRGFPAIDPFADEDGAP